MSAVATTTGTDNANRTEMEMAAELLAFLIASRLVPAAGEWLEQACALASIPMSAVREAEDRLHVEPFRPPRTPLSVVRSAPAEPAPAPRQERVVPPVRRPATTMRPRREGQLFCRPHDNGTGAWLPEDDFALRADRPGHRKAHCVECTRSYSKARYLSAARLALITANVRARLHEGSPFIGDLCPNCDQPLAADDAVTVADVVVCHQECPVVAV